MEWKLHCFTLLALVVALLTCWPNSASGFMNQEVCSAGHKKICSNKNQLEFSHSQPHTSTELFVKGRVLQFEDEDYYFVLNLTRSAERPEIRQRYRILAKEWHPDNFVDELRFEPEALSASQLKDFLDSERVGSTNLIEKSELINAAWKSHRRTQNVNSDLEERRKNITNRFALLNEAYTTLYDDDLRRVYNLSGDWGIVGLSGTRNPKKRGDMGDREEAARVRERAEAAQRTPLQERVYQRYMKEKEEKEAAEAAFQARMAEKRAKEKEALRLERERLGLPDLDSMSSEERRKYNQDQIKKQWSNLFSGVNKKFFGGN